MTKLNGCLAVVKTSTTSAASVTQQQLQMDATFDESGETIDTTTKDDVSNGKLYKSEEVGSTTGTLTWTQMADDTSMASDTEVGQLLYFAFQFGGRTAEGQCRVTGRKNSAPLNGKATYEVTAVTVGHYSWGSSGQAE